MSEHHTSKVDGRLVSGATWSSNGRTVCANLDGVEPPCPTLPPFVVPSVATLTELTEGVRGGLGWALALACDELDAIQVRVRVYRDGRPWSFSLTSHGQTIEVDGVVDGGPDAGVHIDATSKIRADDTDELVAAVAQSLHEDLTVQAEKHTELAEIVRDATSRSEARDVGRMRRPHALRSASLDSR
jgi:hypothetical protein